MALAQGRLTRQPCGNGGYGFPGNTRVRQQLAPNCSHGSLATDKSSLTSSFVQFCTAPAQVPAWQNGRLLPCAWANAWVVSCPTHNAENAAKKTDRDSLIVYSRLTPVTVISLPFHTPVDTHTARYLAHSASQVSRPFGIGQFDVKQTLTRPEHVSDESAFRVPQICA